MIGDIVTVTVDRLLGSYHPEYMTFSREEIAEQIQFQEKFYQSEIEV